MLVLSQVFTSSHILSVRLCFSAPCFLKSSLLTIPLQSWPLWNALPSVVCSKVWAQPQNLQVLGEGLTCAGDSDKAGGSDEEQCLEVPGGWMHSARLSKLKAQSSRLRRGTETATKQTGTCLLWVSGVRLLTLLQQSVWGLKKKIKKAQPGNSQYSLQYRNHL